MSDSSFSRLMQLAGRSKGRMITANLLAVLSVAFGIAPYLLVYYAFEAHLAGNAQAVWAMASAAAASLLLKPLCFGLSTGIAHSAAFDTLADLRMKLLEKFARLPLGYFSARQTGNIKRVVNENTEVLELFLSHQLPDVVSAMVAPVATLVLLASVDWRLALAAAGIFPIVWMANLLIMRGHGDKIGTYFQLHGKINAALVEYLQGIETLKSTDGGRATLERFRGNVNAFSTFADDWRKSWMAPWSLFSVATGASLLFVTPIGLLLITNGASTPSVLLFAIMAATGIGGPIIKLMLYTEIFMRVQKAEESIHVVFSEKEIVQEAAAEPLSFNITFNNVTFRENNRTILSGVSFDIAENAITAFVGPSGAGKTSLIRLIARHWDATEGEVLLGGRNVKDYALEALLSNIAVISQDVFLFDDTIAANIRIGRNNASLEDIQAAAHAANADAFIKALPQGYDTVIGGNGARLSGGERQRISLARALLRDAPVLIMDEATAHVDPLTEALIQDAINRLAGQKTVIIVSHRLDSVTHCDTIILMGQGQVQAHGSHDQLLSSSPIYKSMWDVQQRNIAWSLMEGRAVGETTSAVETAEPHNTASIEVKP